ncbi:MAG TPA: hypothetical protein VJ250_06295 [Nitrososphaeraceae archaeon]|nr:hypothetical protein [Nitrososphaeraceae archaeon]
MNCGIKVLIGNVSSQLSIENATKIRYDYRNQPECQEKYRWDAGFGSSKFAIVVTQFVDGKIQVIFAEEYDKA